MSAPPCWSGDDKSAIRSDGLRVVCDWNNLRITMLDPSGLSEAEWAAIIKLVASHPKSLLELGFGSNPTQELHLPFGFVAYKQELTAVAIAGLIDPVIPLRTTSADDVESLTRRFIELERELAIVRGRLEALCPR